MATAQLTFDKLAYIDRLKAAGIEDKQARAHAEGLDQALREEVATKSDLVDIRTDLAGLRGNLEKLDTKIESAENRLESKIDVKTANLQAAVAELHASIIKWMLGLSISALAVGLGAASLIFKH